MRDLLRRLAGMVAGYGAIQWAGPLLSLIFTPIITRLLTPSDYGVADFVLTVASALGTIAVFGLPQALVMHYNDKPSEEWKATVSGATLAVTLVWGIPLGLLVVAFASPLALATLGEERFTPLFQIVGATVGFAAAASVLTTAAQAALRVTWGMALSAAAIITTIAGNVLFIVVMRLGATGMVLTAVSIGLVTSLVGAVLMRGSLRAPSAAAVRTLLRSGIVLFPVVASSWALLVVDRFFLVQFVSTESLGFYAIASKVASLLFVAMSPLYMAWTPLALSMDHDDPAVRERYAIMGRYMAGLLLVAALGLGLFASEILSVFTRAPYLPAAPYVGFLCYAHVFGGFRVIVYTGALAGKRIAEASGATVLGALVNIGLNALLIPAYGLWGATIATAVGYAVPALVLYLLLRRRFPVPYPVMRIVAALAVQAVLLILALSIPNADLVARLATKVGLVVVLLLAYLALGMVTPFELRQALAAVRGLAGRRGTR